MASLSSFDIPSSPKSTKPCAGCSKLLDQDQYSKAQWKKGATKQCKCCVEEGAPPAWLQEAEANKAKEDTQAMEWVARRAAESDAVEAKKEADAAAVAMAAAAKVALRQEALTMFESNGDENTPFELSLSEKAGETVSVKFRGYKGQGQVRSLTFANDGTFTASDWSEDPTNQYECVLSGWYLCKNSDGDMTGRVDTVTFTGLPNDMVVPKVGDFVEGNHQASLNKLDPKKITLTFVAARGRTRSRAGSGGSGSFGH